MLDNTGKKMIGLRIEPHKMLCKHCRAYVGPRNVKYVNGIPKPFVHIGMMQFVCMNCYFEYHMENDARSIVRIYARVSEREQAERQRKRDKND